MKSSCLYPIGRPISVTNKATEKVALFVVPRLYTLHPTPSPQTTHTPH